MKRIVTAAALALLTSTAHAETQRLATEGYWKTDLAGTAERPLCVSSTELTSAAGIKKWVMLKVGREGNLYFHLSKANWRLPDGAEVPMSVTFDTGVRHAIGTTIKITTSDAYANMVEVIVRDDAIDGIMADFSNAKALIFTFNGGNEAPWTVNMTGSRTAALALATCAARITSPTSPVPPQATSPVPPQATSPVAPAVKLNRGSI